MRYIICVLAVLLLSCEVKVNTKGYEAAKPVRNKNKIRNAIKVETTGGLKVEQAFLTYADDGSFVDEENVTTINKPVKINLVVTGWEEKDGYVSLDAEQTVTTSEGQVVLKKEDMLSNYKTLSAKDAENLNFEFVITKLTKIFDYFLVEVRAANKEVDQEVRASVKIHVE